MKQIWKLNTFRGAVPEGVTMIMLRNGKIWHVDICSMAYRYSWDTALWKKFEAPWDIVAYHVEGDYKC